MSNLRASIDIGSNSVLLLIAELNNDQVSVKLSLSEVTGLGKQLDKNGSFLQESMDATFEVLKDYALTCQNHGLAPSEVLVTATEASRVSANSEEFYLKIKSEIGLDVKIISGDAEAYFSAKGILFDKEIQQEVPIVMDIGGASTELIQVSRSSGELLNCFSMPMGAVRLTNWKEEGVQKEKIESIFNTFKPKIEKVKTPYLHCVAGTMTSIANMCLGHKEFVESEVHGMEIKVSRIKELREKTQDFTPAEYLKKYPFLGKRSSTISGGMDLALTVFDWLGVDEVRISTYGLRYGVLLTGVIKDGYLDRK